MSDSTSPWRAAWTRVSGVALVVAGLLATVATSPAPAIHVGGDKQLVTPEQPLRDTVRVRSKGRNTRLSIQAECSIAEATLAAGESVEFAVRLRSTQGAPTAVAEEARVLVDGPLVLPTTAESEPLAPGTVSFVKVRAEVDCPGGDCELDYAVECARVDEGEHPAALTWAVYVQTLGGEGACDPAEVQVERLSTP